MSDARPPDADGVSPSGWSGALSRRRALKLVVLSGGALTLAPLLNACGGTASAPTAQPPAAPAGAPVAPASAPAADAKPAQVAPGGFTGGGSLSLLLRAHFVPAYDKWFDEWAAEWGKK